MRKPSKSLIKKTAREMFYAIRDKQRDACKANGWGGGMLCILAAFQLLPRMLGSLLQSGTC